MVHRSLGHAPLNDDEPQDLSADGSNDTPREGKAVQNFVTPPQLSSTFALSRPYRKFRKNFRESLTHPKLGMTGGMTGDGWLGVAGLPALPRGARGDITEGPSAVYGMALRAVDVGRDVLDGDVPAASSCAPPSRAHRRCR